MILQEKRKDLLPRFPCRFAIRFLKQKNNIPPAQVANDVLQRFFFFIKLENEQHFIRISWSVIHFPFDWRLSKAVF